MNDVLNGVECELSSKRTLTVVETDPAQRLDVLLGRLSHSVLSSRSVGPAESAITMMEAKSAYEQVHPETKVGQAQVRALRRAQGLDVSDSVSLTFARFVASRTGLHKRSIERLCRWGATIAPDVLQAMKSVKAFDKGHRLDELARLDDHGAQRARLRRWQNPNDPPPPRPLPMLVGGNGDVDIGDDYLRIASLNVELRLGDSLDLLPAVGQFDAIITDPPYGIAYKGAQGPVDGDQSIEEATRGIPHMVGALKENAFACLFTRWDVEPEWVRRLTNHGLNWRAQKIWRKDSSTMVGGRGAVQRNLHENIMVTSKGMPRPHRWQDLTGITGEVGRDVRLDGSVFEHPVPPAMDHSTPKPVELCERLVRSYCPEAGVVLDPYMGTGPVALAAIRSGRGYLGIEKVQAHFAVAVARVVAELGLDAESGGFAQAA